MIDAVPAAAAALPSAGPAAAANWLAPTLKNTLCSAKGMLLAGSASSEVGMWYTACAAGRRAQHAR